MTLYSVPCLNPVHYRPLRETEATSRNALSPAYPSISVLSGTGQGSDSWGAFCPRPQDRALARALIGSALKVYRQLGPELPFACYRTALFRELRLTQTPFLTGVPCEVVTLGNDPVSLGRLDFVLGGQLAVQLHEGTVPLASLKGALFKRMAVNRCGFGVLLNFSAPNFRQVIERLVA